MHKITLSTGPFQTHFSQWPIKFDFGWPRFVYVFIEAIKYGTNINKNGVDK